MPYCNTARTEWGLSAAQIVARFPNTSFPVPFGAATFEAQGFVWYHPTPTPATTRLEAVREIAPGMVGDVLQQRWQVVDITADMTEAQVADLIETLRAEKRAEITATRYVKEVGGVSVGGSVINTDRESQSLIIGAYTAAKNGIADSFDFKAATGWVTLPAATMIVIGEAVFAHIQGCFTREKELHAQVDGAVTLMDVLNINHLSGWPS